MNIAILKTMIISMNRNQMKNIIKDNEFLFFHWLLKIVMYY